MTCRLSQTELTDAGPGLTQGDKLRALKSRRPPRPTTAGALRYQNQNQALTEAKALRTAGAVEEKVLSTCIISLEILSISSTGGRSKENCDWYQRVRDRHTVRTSGYIQNLVYLQNLRVHTGVGRIR